MPLSVGTRLGSYDVLAPIGAGGMGEVYRAKDTKLDRDVALKILPEAFAADADRMARFEREAKLLAALNHPNIAAIYGLEQSALVMELVEGPTLAERIAHASIPLEEALPIAKQIAEALQYAHGRGIIHRDLKPANIKVTPEGRVKVLDFGLAKAMASGAAPADPASSPTLTMRATQMGVILGTAAYMAPEQARGHDADKRADIWSFGVVLFEVLTGRATFTGQTVSDTLASVLKTDPDWSALPTETPSAIRRLLRRCLERDRDRRLHDIADGRLEIDEAQFEPEAAMAAPSAKSAGIWGWAVAVALALALAANIPFHRTPFPDARPTVRLNAELGPGVMLAKNNLRGGLAISPDGQHLVCRISGADGKVRLGIRPLDQTNVTALAGSEGATNPFFSPDGRSIGFFANGKLKKISTKGGVPVTLCDAPVNLGGSWGDDGNMIATLGLTSGLSRIPSAGGAPTPVTELNRERGELRHSWPQVLPGSKAVLYTSYNIAGGFRQPNIEILSLQSGARKTLGAGFSARYLPSGYLVYIHQKTLFAVPFDLGRLALAGSPQPIAADISNAMDLGAEFDFSQNGIFVYSEAVEERRSIFWLDSAGKTQPLHTAPGVYTNPRFSPDGKHLAFDMDDSQGNRDIWVQDLERGTVSRRTLLAGPNEVPVWTPDSLQIVFLSSNPAAPGIYSTRADGSAEPHRLTDAKSRMVPGSISPDGKWLAGVTPLAGGGTEIWDQPLEGTGDHLQLGKPEAFLRSPFIKILPAFSPDGRWLAYNSNESGRHEVYVRPFPDDAGGARRGGQISTDGGSVPVWSPNRHELFFRGADMRIMVAAYTATADSFTAAKPHVWSEQRVLEFSPPAPSFDVGPDGKRFAVILYADGLAEPKPITHLTFLLNFFDELRQRAPAGGR